jgi:hypothetical protein
MPAKSMWSVRLHTSRGFRKPQKGNIETEISYTDNHSNANCAARVSFRSLINVDEELTSTENLN